jgi:DNA polymerase III subunit epsilon
MVGRLRHSLLSSPARVVEALTRRMSGLAEDERYEDAGRCRDRLSAFLRGAARSQRLAALTRCPEVVAARKEDGRWAVHVVRHGRLAAAGVIPPGADASLWVLELQAGAETVVPGPGPTPAASAEETEVLLRWLESEGVRLVHVDGDWTCPVDGAAAHLALHDAVEESRRSLTGFEH